MDTWTDRLTDIQAKTNRASATFVGDALNIILEAQVLSLHRLLVYNMFIVLINKYVVHNF